MRHDTNTADMTELLLRGLGELIYDGVEGAVVRQNGRGTIITDITDGSAMIRVLNALALPEVDNLVVKSRSAFDAAKENYGFVGSCPCTQWAYTKKEAPPLVPCDIRPLPMELSGEAAAHYHLIESSLSYFQERIRAGLMWGLFEGEDLAGFIGLHTEGAIGMLEILPEFRRKGYGYALEAYVIDWHLKRGWTPYCHVVNGNEASVRLQTKLGMACGDLPALWIY